VSVTRPGLGMRGHAPKPRPANPSGQVDRREPGEGAGPPLLWHHCATPATARVRFVLPNLLGGSERDYCQPHTELVREAKGIRVVRRFGPQQPTLPGLADAGSEATAAGRGRTRRKGVIG
jgi:hypothetical protein